MKVTSDKITLKEKILSDENIFSAIYSVESYIEHKNLLSKDDLELLYKLKDKHNKALIIETIEKCKKVLERILSDKDYFEIQVFFKAKKWHKADKINSEKKEQSEETDQEQGKKYVECRPMHTASLITQICIVCLLNQIMFKESKDGHRELSDLAQLIPSNFYGNIPTVEPERVFYDWRVKYKEYTEKVIGAYDEAVKNHTYKYEVALDLENFFPSVNPNIIYNLCLEKIGHLYKEDIDVFKLVLEKLLKFKITNLETSNSLKKYYGNNKFNILNTISIGIPQGLPQSNFFGNLCMTIIYKKFDEVFPGKAFYYVDDSTIYTNSENASKAEFYDSIDVLNQKIEDELKLYIKYGNDDNEKNKEQYINYQVRVHKNEKSTSSEIENSQKLSKAFLTLVAKEASGVGYDINTTMETLEDVVLKKKLDVIELAVDCEIENLEKYNLGLNEIDAAEISFCSSYKKSLYRYKKFFKYRKHLLNYRDEKNCVMLENEFKENYFLDKYNNEIRQEIMQKLDADNFIAEAQLIFMSKSNNVERDEFIQNIKAFEKNLIIDVDEKNLYFSNCFKYINTNISIYDTLDNITKEYIEDFSKTNTDKSIEFVEKNIKNLPNAIGYGEGYDKLIFDNSNEYKRRIYNACISRIFNMYLSDDLQIHRKDGRNITYYELFIFSYFRNRYADMKNFVFPDKKFKDEKLGYDVYEILNLFITYVKKPEYVYQLLLMHKYISSIWKNGSRFLYFYTLHNQEHSIELIKRVISICKVIDYFKIKSEDYYILFLCCYLHDVSMAIQPKIDSFTSDNEQTDILSSEFYGELKKAIDYDCYNKPEIKKLMKQAFEKVNEYFETIARDKHAYNSADFIKNSPDLSSLNSTVRKEVAAISEAHAYDWKDVYDLKSNARTECISEKYLMILLRIADLVDGAKDRVSLNILRHNISNMPNESKFHWVTHAITDGIDIESEYAFLKEKVPSNEEGFVSILNKKYLTEKIVVTIKVNEYILTSVNRNNCKNASAKLIKDKNEIVINLGENKVCDANCIFLCKWLMTKNNYLLSELNALQLYFNRNASNLFNTKIQMKIKFEDAKEITSEYFSIVDKKING